MRELNPRARLVVFGQEVNPESYAICKSDMLIKGENTANIKFGNSFTMDGLEAEKFDYMLSNPPFGVEWKKVQAHIKKEHETKGFGGRFGAGLPRISDGYVIYKNRDKFKKTLKEHCKTYGLSLPASIKKAVLKVLSKQDEIADICLDKKEIPSLTQP